MALGGNYICFEAAGVLAACARRCKNLSLKLLANAHMVLAQPEERGAIPAGVFCQTWCNKSTKRCSGYGSSTRSPQMHDDMASPVDE